MWKRLRRDLLLAAFAAAIVLASASTTAQAHDPWNRHVVFQVKDEPLESVLLDLGTSSKTRIELTPAAKSVAGKQRVTVNMDGVPLRTVIEAVARTAAASGRRLTARFQDDLCTIDVADAPVAARPPAEAIGPDRRLISYNAKDASVVKIVTDLLKIVGAGWRIEPSLRKELEGKRVTVEFGQVELRSALSRLLGNASGPVTTWYEPKEGYYVFMPAPKDAGNQDAVATLNGSGKDNLSASFNNMDVRYALKAIFRATGGNYTLDHRVAGTVTVDFKGLPLREAITMVLRHVKSPLTYSWREENGVFNIVPNRDYESWK